jgi:hypothetical protein
MAVVHVRDYAADKAAGVVKRGKPRRLHRPDCPHTSDLPQATYRPATREELQSLPECADCARKG